MSLQATTEEVRVGTGRKTWREDRVVVRITGLGVCINQPNPRRAVAVLVDKVVHLFPPKLSSCLGVTTVRSVRDQNPASQKISIATYHEPLWIFVTDLEVLWSKESRLPFLVISNRLTQIDPQLDSILSTTLSGANSQDIMGGAEDLLTAAFLDSKNVESMCFHLFVQIVQFAPMSQRSFGN